MKGFLDKTWAKAAAFVLTLVFGVLTVLGGVGVGILISYDVFLDGGDFLRQTMYEGNCVRSIDTADSFLRGTLANAGVLVSDGTYDYSTVENGDVTDEERAQVISDLPRVFAEEFSRDAADCHLTVTVRGNGEVVGTFENFELTDGDKPLYATQETFTYQLNTGNTAMVTIAADLLRTEEAPSYSYLLDMWLVEHTALTVILTVLFAALALFFFCFLMASAGHWAGHEGIHLTWLGKIPADVWLIVLLCTFFIGWEAFYYGWGRVFFCAALVPLVLLFLCAFAAQCKAGTVLRSSLLARIGRFVWRIVRALFLGLWRIARNLPLIWKTALAGLILVFIEFVLFMQDYYGTLAAPFLALKLAELLAVLYVAVNLRTLQKGGEKLARGDFSSPIDTKYLIGDFKRYGQELNDVQSGLEQAVQELGRWIGESGNALVYGGSRCGLMGEIAESTLSAGGKVTGVEPEFFVQGELQHEGLTELIVTKDMTERKTKMIALGDAFIAFPGGTGTLEEIAEVMSKVSLRHLDAPCILYNLNGYYDGLKALLARMIEKGLSSPERQQGIYFVEDLEQIKEILQKSF